MDKVNYLIAKGGRLWQKDAFNRVYFNQETLLKIIDEYNGGYNSNDALRYALSCDFDKNFYDVNTDKFVGSKAFTALAKKCLIEEE